MSEGVGVCTVKIGRNQLWFSSEMNTDIPNPLKVSIFNVFMSIRAYLKQRFFSPVWRINTAENGHRKHIFLKSLQSRYFGKHRFCSTRWDGWKRKFLQTSTLWCCIACFEDMVYTIRGPAATQARYCIHNDLVPRVLFSGFGGGAGKGH